MRDTDEVNEILQQATPSRPRRVIRQEPRVQESFLTTEEITRIVQQSSTEQQEEPIEIEPVQEIPQEVQEMIEQYIQPINADDSAEDVHLSEAEEKLYDNIIVRDETARFSSAEWFSKAQQFTITIAGIGGIGSWSSLLLARLKPFGIHLIDPDTVELVNLAGQLYGVTDVGKSKVSAVCDYMRNNAHYYNGYEHMRSVSETRFGSEVMICGFDNMDARTQFFNSWKRQINFSNNEGGNRSATLFIDGRLTATEFQVFCMTGEDTALIERYSQEYLFSDEEASHEICSFKQTAYLANMISGVIVNLYVNFCANLCGSPFKKALPFLTKYNTDMMMFNTEY